MKLENQYKSQSFGIASNIILAGTILTVILYDFSTPQFAPDENRDAVVLTAIVEGIRMLQILAAGCLLSLGCAIISLLLKEKKLFPLITIGFIAIPLLLIWLTWTVK